MKYFIIQKHLYLHQLHDDSSLELILKNKITLNFTIYSSVAINLKSEKLSPYYEIFHKNVYLYRMYKPELLRRAWWKIAGFNWFYFAPQKSTMCLCFFFFLRSVERFPSVVFTLNGLDAKRKFDRSTLRWRHRVDTAYNRFISNTSRSSSSVPFVLILCGAVLTLCLCCFFVQNRFNIFFSPAVRHRF